jgi:hypothetical protein
MSQPMSDKQRGDRQAADGAYALGIEMLDRGEPPAVVEKELIEAGSSPEAAKSIVESYSRATVEAQSEGGRTEMMQGALVAGGGLLVILYTGSVIGWLGIILGGVQVFRGWRLR